MPDKIVLMQYQALPLEAKISMTLNRIREWYNFWCGDVFISFSGGKDSTVLADLVHSLYPDVPLVFSNTGLEFPEIVEFAKSKGAVMLRPKMSFPAVLTKYGYPIVSKENSDVISSARHIQNGSKGARGNVGKIKTNVNGEWLNWRRKALHGIPPFDKGAYAKKKWLPLARDTQFNISSYCCNVMKKNPLNQYSKGGFYPYIGTLACESALRERIWLKNGCNSYDTVHKSSNPLSFWTEQDILQYIKQKGLQICSVYGDIVEVNNELTCSGYNRTGCTFCLFGCHLEKEPSRFQMLKKTHPKLYDYCLRGGQWVDNPAYDESAPEYDDFWKNWNPQKIWIPGNGGLGMQYVFDCCNAIYGKGFIKYD